MFQRILERPNMDNMDRNSHTRGNRMTIFTRVIEFLDGSDGVVEPIPSCVHSLETERKLQRLGQLLEPNENVKRPDQAMVSIVGPAGTGKTTQNPFSCSFLVLQTSYSMLLFTHE